MRWPWQKFEKRQSAGPYTQAVIAGIVEAATGETAGDANELAAVEVASALWASAFAAGTVTNATMSRVLPASTRALIARNLVRHGESVHVITLAGRGMLRLMPVGTWDVRGGVAEHEWSYRIDQYGPTRQMTRIASSDQVLHARYAVDSARPWRGIAPLQWARQTGTLAANLELRLGEEAGGAVGHVIPVPSDGGDGGEDDPLASFKSDLRGAKGRTVVAETTAAGWGDGKAQAPVSDYKAMRFGANPPQPVTSLRTDVAGAVLTACGVPVSLVTDADGTSQRESWRRFVLGTIEPALEVLADECEIKLDRRPVFDLRGLWAHDLQGRASAFQRLVAGGMGLQEAAAASGVLADPA